MGGNYPYTENKLLLVFYVIYFYELAVSLFFDVRKVEGVKLIITACDSQEICLSQTLSLLRNPEQSPEAPNGSFR